MNVSPKKTGKKAEAATPDLLENIKKTTIISLFSDDDLLDLLVLKGGNAMDIVHKVSSRASVDIDLSVDKNFDHDTVWPKVEKAILDGFAAKGYLAFDIKMSIKPGKMPDELASFWGGYLVEFKLISLTRAAEIEQHLETMRREAIMLGQGSKFTIDISRHEYTEGKQPHDLDGYTIYVYSPEMIVCEKLRAICQQMPEYAEVIKRNGLGNQRARDFIDIEVLVKQFNIDLGNDRARHLVEQMFSIKRVPLALLSKIPQTRDFHAHGYLEVRDSIKPGIEVHPFDYYFDFVNEHLQKLETLWNV
jgi:predicted nucleotidyltransferase component of viral defense system